VATPAIKKLGHKMAPSRIAFGLKSAEGWLSAFGSGW